MPRSRKPAAPDSLVVNQITLHQLQQQQLDVARYRKALQTASRVTIPWRKALLEIYQELMLDAHLYAIVQKRIRNVKNTPITYVEDGKDTTTVNDMLEGPWFIHMIEHIMGSIFYGHSLVEFELREGYISEAHLIPRHHVHPERGVITLSSAYDITGGLPYREPPYANFMLEVGMPNELGLLNIAAVNTILKRNGRIDHANFVEMFGSPIRDFEYDPSVPGAREEAERIAKEAGNSVAITRPRDQMSLTLHSVATSGSSDDVHTRFIDSLKQELSILVLGQTMTTEDGSSRSQAEVHENEQEKITHEDKMLVSYVLNYHFKPLLAGLGYPVDKGHFQFDEGENLTPVEKADLYLKLSQLVEIDQEQIYREFDLDVPGKKKAN